MVKIDEWKPLFKEYTNNAGHKLKVFAKRGKKVKIQFVNTGYTTEAYIDNVKAGNVTDPYEISVYGIGYIGEFERVSYWRQAKQLWNNMMKRCYSEKDPRGYFGKAFVDARWRCFANFLEDLPKLENFNEWLKGQEDGAIKYNLDKDLMFEGNKTYSRDMCMFVTEFENKSAGGINRQKK